MRSALVVTCALFAVLGTGCSSAPPPGPGAAPPANPPAPSTEAPSAATLIEGAADSVRSIPGSEHALYVFRFRQIEPASDRFNFRDRDLSFALRPTPSALYFQVENLQGRPVWIDWDRSTFRDPEGRSGPIATSASRWTGRFERLPLTQIPAQGRISEYTFPRDYLMDPGTGSDPQPRRPLLPEDESAPAYTDRIFGMDLTLVIEDRPRTYSFRYRVASVIPR